MVLYGVTPIHYQEAYRGGYLIWRGILHFVLNSWKFDGLAVFCQFADSRLQVLPSLPTFSGLGYYLVIAWRQAIRCSGMFVVQRSYTCRENADRQILPTMR